VSIGTCTALARFIGHSGGHTPAQVGVPVGFHKPVPVDMGMGFDGYGCGLPWKTPG
jgi:hypothetical protein